MTEQNVQLDLQLIKENLPQYDHNKLCEMIASARYFGFDQKIITMCMEELAARRIAGNTFDFESYIDQVYQQFPVLDFKTPDIRAVLNQAIKMKGKIF